MSRAISLSFIVAVITFIIFVYFTFKFITTYSKAGDPVCKFGYAVSTIPGLLVYPATAAQQVGQKIVTDAATYVSAAFLGALGLCTAAAKAEAAGKYSTFVKLAGKFCFKYGDYSARLVQKRIYIEESADLIIRNERKFTDMLRVIGKQFYARKGIIAVPFIVGGGLIGIGYVLNGLAAAMQEPVIRNTCSTKVDAVPDNYDSVKREILPEYKDAIDSKEDLILYQIAKRVAYTYGETWSASVKLGGFQHPHYSIIITKDDFTPNKNVVITEKDLLCMLKIMKYSDKESYFDRMYASAKASSLDQEVDLFSLSGHFCDKYGISEDEILDPNGKKLIYTYYGECTQDGCVAKEPGYLIKGPGNYIITITYDGTGGIQIISIKSG